MPNIISLVDLVELDMFNFDMILGMDWLHAFFASINYRTRVVKFQFPKEPIYSGWGEILCQRSNHFLIEDL